MSALDEQLAATRADFADYLQRHGFLPNMGQTWRGSLVTAAGTRRSIEVSLGPGWPFQPPIVTPLDDDVPFSWHRERNGGLCLYTQDDRENLPWLDVDGLLGHATRWFEQAELGWPNDPPDLDLERYFEHATPLMTVLYNDLTSLLQRFIRLRATRNQTLTVIGTGVAPKQRGGRGRSFGYCANLGTVAVPPRSWADLTAMLPEDVALVIERCVQRRTVSVLLLQYDRDGNDGVLALAAGSPDGKRINLAAYNSASSSQAARTLRAGPGRTNLAGKRVAVVGCGAVGSFLADALARAGVGSLTLQDGDVLRPGNLVRHLADDRHVGLSKAESVRAVIQERGQGAPDMTVVSRSLLLPDEAVELLGDHDLVIDATADGSATAMLATAARSLGTAVLSVCLQNDGDTVRVDVLPTLDDAAPLPKAKQRSRRAPIYESGCGDPVAPTPPYAVQEAAAVAARHAAALLSARPISPTGEVREYSERCS
jgi:hypothetical protein